MITTKQIFTLLTAGLFFFTANATVFAQPAFDQSFNPDILISDYDFSNVNAWSSASQVQAFLEAKGSPLANTTPAFLGMLLEPESVSVKTALKDPNANLNRKRTAAELIFDSSVRAGLNPQATLALINKEQGLITGRRGVTNEVMQTALNHAVGYGCQGSNCQNIYIGFYYQLFGNVDAEGNTYLGATRSLMRAFSTPGGLGPYYEGRTTRVGDVVLFRNYSTTGFANVPPSQTVTIGNRATAAMYRYDPFVFNSNYNFWYFFKEWFGSSGSDIPGSNLGELNGKAVKSSRTSTTIYFIENGQKYRLYPFVAEARNIDIDRAEVISRSKLDDYSSAGNLSVPDKTLVEYEDDLYFFSGNKKYLVTEEQARARGLKPNEAINGDSDARRYDTGNLSDLTPVTPPSSPTPAPAPVPNQPEGNDPFFKEGAILRGNNSPAVYLVSGGKLKLFTFATFVQYAAAANMTLVSDDLLSKYPKDGLVLPKNGSLVKSFNSPTVYFYEDNQKKPMDGEIFRNRGFSFTNVFELDQNEIDALALGKFPVPADNSYYRHKISGELFWFKDGQKRFISKLVALNRSITPDFVFGEETVDHLTSGSAIMPKDGVVLKGDKSPAVYQVVDGKLALMSYEAFVGRKINPAQISIVPDAEIALYPTGPILAR